VDTTHHPDITRSSSTLGEEQPTDARRTSTAFRIVSWIVALATLAIAIFGLLEIPIMWLPDDTLVSLLGDGDPNPLELDYRSQFFHIGIVAWTLVPPLFAQLRRPGRRVAPLLQVWLGGLALIVVMALVGGLEPQDFIIFGAYTVLAALHPSRSELFRAVRFDRLQAGLAAVAAVPWLIRAAMAVDDARNAGDFEVGESPVHMVEGNVALAVVLMLIVAVLGATDTSSWKLPAWTAALAPAALGVHSLVFDEQAASLPVAWAIAAIAWGGAYAAAIVHRTRPSASAG
jgi:hypothetical protein